jgi:F420-non-reducing hydrogenase iron-sulfur subunit
MAKQSIPGIFIYLCKNCIPGGRFLPVQWDDAGMHIRIKEIPCSGKIDTQYILHAFEGGVHGVCIVACPQGDCTLSQGNYRAEVRVRTAQRLLKEMDLDPNRIELLHCSKNESIDHLKEILNEAICRMSKSVPAHAVAE